MNLWSVHAKASTHNGSRWFHVIAYTQPEASRVACAEAPRAGEIGVKLTDPEKVGDRQYRALWSEAVNVADWQPPYPQFCINPVECAGKSCCPRSYACSE